MSYQALEVMDWCIRLVTDRERRAIHRGQRGAQCKWHELRDTGMKAAEHAHNIGAKSWDIIPMTWLGKEDPKVFIKFYNREGHGMCGFGGTEDVTGRVRGKKDFWFDDLPQPHWFDRERGVRDGSEGTNWHPEYA